MGFRRSSLDWKCKEKADFFATSLSCYPTMLLCESGWGEESDVDDDDADDDVWDGLGVVAQAKVEIEETCKDKVGEEEEEDKKMEVEEDDNDITDRTDDLDSKLRGGVCLAVEVGGLDSLRGFRRGIFSVAVFQRTEGTQKKV